MAPWGGVQRQLLNYIARHPQFHKMLKNGAEKVTKSPHFQKAQSRMKVYYENMSKEGARAAGGKGQQQQQQTSGGGGPQFSSFSKMKRRIQAEWHVHKGRLFAFVTANFFFIVMMLPLAGDLWRLLVTGVKALMAPPSDSERKSSKKQKNEAVASEDREDAREQPTEKRHPQKQATKDSLKDEEGADVHRHRYMSEKELEEQQRIAPRYTGPFSNLTSTLGGSATEHTTSSPSGTPSPMFFFGGTPESSSSSSTSHSTMFDDTVAARANIPTKKIEDQFNDMHRDMFRHKSELGDINIDFNTSFLVKMGDEKEFTSSLERENLTGSISTH